MSYEEVLRIKRRIYMEQKNNLFDMYHNGIITFEVYEELKAEIDATLLELENIGI